MTPGPPPTTSVEEALASTAKRRERDEQLARWCGLSEDEVGPFLTRLALYDARTPVYEARDAEVEAKAIRARIGLDEDLAAFWAEQQEIATVAA